MTQNKILSLFLLLIATVLLSGCIPQIGTTQTVEKNEYVKGVLVANFPPLVPIYKGAKVVESYGFDSKFGASFLTGDDLSKVTKFYSDSLPTLGWETSVSASGANNFTFNIKNQTQQGTVIVNKAADGKTTAITISVLPTAQ